MGNIKEYVITGEAKEPLFDEQWLMEQFRANHVALHFSHTPALFDADVLRGHALKVHTVADVVRLITVASGRNVEQAAADGVMHHSFIAAVESSSMSADNGVWALIRRCVWIKLHRIDTTWGDVHGLYVDEGRGTHVEMEADIRDRSPSRPSFFSRS